MNRIQRIKTFLEDYESLNPRLRELCEESHHHYQNELIREYVKLGKHPYPNEYLQS